MTRIGMTRIGEAGQVRRDGKRSGRHETAWQARRGLERHGLERHGEAWQGEARRGRQGAARAGEDGLKRHGMAGWARHGTARIGGAWRGRRGKRLKS